MKFRIVFFICTLAIEANGQTYSQWGNLKPGKYGVGYKVNNLYDHGRSIQPKADFEGISSLQNALPVQVSMWYPTAVNANVTRMKYGEYVYLTLQKNNFIPLNSEEKHRAYDVIRTMAKVSSRVELSDEQMKAIYDTPVAAVRDAPFASGKFPVVVSGTDGGPHSLNILYEYLASLGYIVLSTPSIERDGTRQANAPQKVLIDRIGNLEFLVALANELPGADCTKMGVLGVNFDGMSALLYQMKNMQCDAVVSIDGWEGKGFGEETIRSSPFFEANQLRVPYLTVQQHDPDPNFSNKLSQKLFDSFKYSNRYYYSLVGMNHASLIGGLAVLPDLPPDKRSAYEFIFNNIGFFFEAYVRRDAEALVRVNMSSEQQGLKKSMMNTEVRVEAFPAVPTADEFEKIIMSAQFDKAKRILVEGLKNNPELQLIDQGALNLFSFRFRQRKQADNVVAIRQLGVIAFPKSSSAMMQLGEALLMAGRNADATDAFSKTLTLLDNDPQLEEKEKGDLKAAVLKKL
ncbi:MAG: hypothetical protein C0490_10655 [Marivirga sp.]|nr:hypothetical protein [Marivirga sp.]